jgi:hypothetical protein
LEDDGESVPPPVGSGEGLLEGEGLSVGEEPEEGDELGALEGDSVGVTEGSAVGAEEGLGLGATSVGAGAEEGIVPGAEGISPVPAGGVVGGVAAGASTVGDPPGGVAGIISFSAALLIRPYPAIEAPMTRNGRKNFEIFIICTLSFFVLSCETAYMTLLDATYRFSLSIKSQPSDESGKTQQALIRASGFALSPLDSNDWETFQAISFIYTYINSHQDILENNSLGHS